MTVKKLGKLAKKTSHRVAYVRWVDSAGPDGWTFDPLPIALEVLTVGWVLAEDAQRVVLSASVATGDDGQYHSPIAIPRCAILQLEYLS